MKALTQQLHKAETELRQLEGLEERSQAELDQTQQLQAHPNDSGTFLFRAGQTFFADH